MYLVYCDSQLLYDPRVEELAIFNKKIKLEVNKTGGFDFTIYPSHPLYDRIQRLTSSVEVYQDNHLLFRGRVLDDEHDFYNAKHVICEGDLAFLNDGVIRPYSYQGTVVGFLEYVLDEYNNQVDEEKQFILGEVTVTDPNDYITRSSINADSAWNVFNEKLINLLGGYIRIRRNDSVNYLDYLVDSSYQSLQEITLGENLLDLTKSIKGSEVVTALIPYGSRLRDDEGNEVDERVTINSVNGGIDYVYNQEAVDKYGWIFDTATFDNVTLPENLITRGNHELLRRMNLNVSIDVNAIDLSMTDQEIDEFRIFEYIKVNSPSHLLDDYMLVTKLDIDMDNPQNNKLMLGADYSTFTDKQIRTEQAVKEVINKVSGNETTVNKSIANVQTIFQSAIEQASELIRSEVSETYTSTSDFEIFQEATSTQFSQTSESFQFDFESMNQTITALDGDKQAQFEEIKKFIRFEDGNIILGEANHPLQLRIENDRISFILNGNESGYWDGNDGYFHVDKTNVKTSHQIGMFMFSPRENGSLSFGKV